MKNDSYRPRSIKRARRSREDIERLKAALYRIVERDHPMTVRQVFYRAVSAGLVPKTEAAYKSTVVRLLSDMRRKQELPFSWIADNTRWMRKPDSFDSLASALEFTRDTYRRALWSTQRDYVEIWLEKDALSGVLYDVTGQWDVPLMVTRGYPSLSFLYGAAEDMAGVGKPVYLYYLGDRDPSGLDIPRKVEEDLRTFAPSAEIHFERIAVTVEQIQRWNLPTRPTKRTDVRAKDFDGDSVEVDAIEPQELRNLVEEHIVRHIDKDELERLERIEQAERASLTRLIGAGFR